MCYRNFFVWKKKCTLKRRDGVRHYKRKKKSRRYFLVCLVFRIHAKKVSPPFLTNLWHLSILKTMTKRKSKSENTYSIWLESASKLVPPYDYFSFAELANNSEPLTNSSYHQLLLKALLEANMTHTNDITSAINKYKVNLNLT